MGNLTTVKTLKINKEKRVGTVIIVVEGERDEYRLLKHILTEVLGYSYKKIQKNKLITDSYIGKENGSIFYVANTSNSNVNSIEKDESYLERISEVIREEHRDIRYASIYYLWDRDRESNDATFIEKLLSDLFHAKGELDYSKRGLLLLSYPCLEVYGISNFDKKLWEKDFMSSEAAKESLKYSIKNINSNTLLRAAINMNNSLKEMNIINYNVDEFKNTNLKIFKKEEEYYLKKNKYYMALSLITIMFIDLGIISEE